MRIPLGVDSIASLFFRAGKLSLRSNCAEREVEILKRHVSKDHIHLFVSGPPHVSARDLMQRIKGKSSRKLMPQFSHRNKECWGRPLCARGFFVARSGVVTDDAIRTYIRAQDISKKDEAFRIDDE